MATDIRKLYDTRLTEDHLLEIRAHRVNNHSSWHARIDETDKLYRGEWTSIFPGETVEIEKPHVSNLVQITMDDIARLVSESLPSVRAFPKNDTDLAQKNAYLREGIADTYWEVNHGNIILPRLSMDLAGAGASFLVVDASSGDYPCIHRIDPRMAFPTTHDGKILDLLVHQTMKIRVAAQLFPLLELGEKYANPHVADGAEVLEYYGAMENIQAIVITKAGKPVPNGTYIVKRWEHKLGRPPVAFSALDSFDGEFRGMFDQIGGSLNTKNRIFKLILDYSDQLVYASRVSKGLLNPEEKDGPNAHYRLDPNVPDATMGRMQPAGSSPDVWRALEYLEREQRAAAAYPAQRQGEVKQSIASASFVDRAQGALTSVVRNIQRLLGKLREDVTDICFQVDEKYLNTQKALIRPVGKKKDYTPGDDIQGQYMVKVIYGAGAGLDRLNADVRVLQHLGAGLISRETAREQIDYLPQDGEEQDRLEKEMASAALAQKFLTEAPWDMVAKVFVLMGEGKTMVEAIREVMPQAGQGGAPAPEGTPGPAPTPESALEERLALEKGRTGTQPTEPKFQGPPITSILVRPGGQ